MAYDFSTRLDTLGTRMQEVNQTSLTYRRGSTEITVSNPTLGKVDVEQLAAFGITLITDKLQDFIFDTADLSTLEPTTPRLGDIIVWSSRTYEVLPIADELYTFVTSSRARIKVHTKQTG
jgi:hypothetical protein